ncbi:MAG: hypothetical protein AB1467_06045 [Candidatus Diapherotrites archaeon]
MKKILFIMGFALLLAATASAAQATLLSLHGTVKTAGGAPASGSLTVEVWDANDSAGNLVYSESFTGAISSGKFDVMLGASTSLNLNYNQDYYLMLIKDGTTNLFSSRKKFKGGQGQVQSTSIQTGWPTLLNILDIGSNASTFSGVTKIGNSSSTLVVGGGLIVDDNINYYREQGHYVTDPALGTSVPHNDLRIIFGTAVILAGTNSIPVNFGFNFDIGPYSVVAIPEGTSSGGAWYITNKTGSSFIINQPTNATANTTYDYIVIGYYVENPPCGAPPLPPCP